MAAYSMSDKFLVMFSNFSVASKERVRYKTLDGQTTIMNSILEMLLELLVGGFG